MGRRTIGVFFKTKMGRKEMIKVVERIIIYICVAIMLLSAILLVRKWEKLEREQEEFIQMAISIRRLKSKAENEKTRQEEGGTQRREILPEYQNLYEENQDFAGWIQIEGTMIDYPVMWTPKEREYYLHRDFYGNDSYAGTPFAEIIPYHVNGISSESQTSESLVYHVLLYGHNMRNGKMFADLLKYQDKSYWESHSIIRLNTLEEEQKYKVFSVFYAEEEDWTIEEGVFYKLYHHGYKDKAKLTALLVEKSLHTTDYIPQTDDPFVFLITCSNWKKGGRFVVACGK